MADLIKKIKIKKQDGTFTDYIPIGVESENANVDGESVKVKLNKKPYYYNSIADMKADNKLKVGDMIITLGYYEANDGGGGKYAIVENEYAIDDGGSYHQLDNGLWAELIVDNEINIKQFGAYGDGIHNDTSRIQTAIDYASDNKFKVIIPKGAFNILNSINIKKEVEIEGINQKGSIINIVEDITGFIIAKSYITIKNMTFCSNENHTKEMILLTNSDGHTWNQYISQCYFEGHGKTATAITNHPNSTYGNMTININNCMFTGLLNCILFDITTGWSNGGIIKDCWEYNCIYGINFTENSKRIGSWRITNFKGQYHTGSVSLIENFKASTATIDDVILWDGGTTLSIAKESENIIVKNCINLTNAKFKDLGFRTKVIDLESNYRETYYKIKETFWGSELDTNRWKVTQSSQNSIVSTGLSKPNTGLHKPSIKLTTANTANDSILLDFNNKKILPEYAGWYLNFSFFFDNIDNIDFRLGAATGTADYGNWFTIDNNNQLIFASQQGTIRDSIVVDNNFSANKWYNIQLYFKYDNTELHIWNNGTYIGNITPTRWDQEPYFYIKTLNNTEKSVSISDIIIKGFLY